MPAGVRFYVPRSLMDKSMVTNSGFCPTLAGQRRTVALV